MVFVHARNETVRTAFALSELARNKGDSALFTPEQNPSYGEAQKAVSFIYISYADFHRD